MGVEREGERAESCEPALGFLRTRLLAGPMPKKVYGVDMARSDRAGEADQNKAHERGITANAGNGEHRELLASFPKLVYAR